MKAAYIESTGPAENIRFGDLPDPQIDAYDVLVKVTAVCVDPIDTYIRSGLYKIDMPLPFIIGRDMTGIVEAVGASVTKFKQGDRVWANNQGYGGRQGTFAELLSVHEQFLYRLPTNIDDKDAVSLFHSALTAIVGLYRKVNLMRGESIFINGGSGSVGTAVLQIAKANGARVAVTAGNEEKKRNCKELGADLVINYKSENIAECLQKFAPNGVDVYWDATKTADVEQALPVMAQRGRMAIMAGATHRCTLPIGELYRRNCTLYGFTITH